MTFRSKPLRDTAQDKPCKIRLPVCNGRTDTTVWVHSDEIEHGKGKSEKASDAAGAWGCSACHEAISKLPRAQRLLVMRGAIVLTAIDLFELGLVTVAGASARDAKPAHVPKIVSRELPAWRR